MQSPGEDHGRETVDAPATRESGRTPEVRAVEVRWSIVASFWPDARFPGVVHALAHSLSLIIPCYNESASLPALIDRCTQVTRHPDVEVVLVDNGSTDDTPSRLAELLDGRERMRSVRVEVNQGYGFGILSGLRTATSDLVAWTHADLQTDPTDILAALAVYDREADPERLFVKGRRQERPLGDRVFTGGMAILESVLFRQSLWDINAQPTVMPRSFFESWKEPPFDFSLDLYAYVQARRRGLRVERVPVRFGAREHGQSHWNTSLRARFKFIDRTLRYSLQLRRGTLQ